METYSKRVSGLTLVALPGMIALGLMNAIPGRAQTLHPNDKDPNNGGSPTTIHETIQALPCNAQNGNNSAANMQSANGRMDSYGQNWSNNASIAAAGNFVYIFRDGRLYQLRSSGLALVSRKDVAGNRMSARLNTPMNNGANGKVSFHRSAQSQNPQNGGNSATTAVGNSDNSNNANGGYNITTEGGNNAPRNTDNRDYALTQSAAEGQGTVTVPGKQNPTTPLPVLGVDQTGANGAGSSTNNFGSTMAMGMGDNVKVAASGGFVYVLDGNMLYQFRAAGMTRVSRRDLSMLDTTKLAGTTINSRIMHRPVNGQ